MPTMQRSLPLVCSVTLAMMACDAAPPPEPGAAPTPAPTPAETRPARLVATVKHASGNEFFFYASQNVMKVFEKGTYPSRRVQLEMNTPNPTMVDVYRALAPGQAVPRELQDASDRSEAVKPALRHRSTARQLVTPVAGYVAWDSIGGAPDSGGTELDHRCPRDWFKSWACRNPPTSLDLCWLRKTGSGWLESTDVHGFQPSACCYRGAIATTLWWDDCSDPFCFFVVEGTVTHALSAGQWLSELVLSGNNGWDFDARFSVSGGPSGTNGWHMGAIVYD